MEINDKKVLISAIVVALVVLISFNFEKITGQAVTGDEPTTITITSGKNVYGNGQIELLLTNSYPNQQINVRKLIGNQATRHSLTAKNCKTIGGVSSNEYQCTATKQFGNEELINGQKYYVQAEDRYGRPEGNKAEFKFIKI